MTTIEKCVVGLGACVSALLLWAIIAASGTGQNKPSQTTSQIAPISTVAKSPRDHASSFGESVALRSVPETTSARPDVEQSNPLPANATSVPDANLLQLGRMVNLASARDQQPDKNQWTRAVSVAEKLLEGPCDCAQRVWLKHFVEMGNYAISDSNGEYHETAMLMATLGRNNREAMALSQKPN